MGITTRDLAFCSLTAKNTSVEFVMAWSRKRDSVITRNFREMALAQRRSGAVRELNVMRVWQKPRQIPEAQPFVSAPNQFTKARALVLASFPDG